MVSLPDLAEMDEGINCSKKGAIEPSSSLRDEFGDGI
jgi:hypothetical protein